MWTTLTPQDKQIITIIILISRYGMDILKTLKFQQKKEILKWCIFTYFKFFTL